MVGCRWSCVDNPIAWADEDVQCTCMAADASAITAMSRLTDDQAAKASVASTKTFFAVALGKRTGLAKMWTIAEVARLHVGRGGGCGRSD